jgi:hypothetical protein
MGKIKARIIAREIDAMVQPILAPMDEMFEVDSYERAVEIFDSYIEANKEKKGFKWLLQTEIKVVT